MFIETLKSIVINLVTVLIFISAVELMAPDNKMKKYIKFVLGLILITAILNPILKFVSNGGRDVISNIKNYEEVFSREENEINSDNADTFTKDDNENSRKKAFVNNFNKNCDNLLRNKFKNEDFKSEVDCDIDFSNITFNVKKLKIGVADNKVNKVKKIVISDNSNENAKDENEKYTEIVNYISDELDISKDKIEVYPMKKDSN
ncbi:stage III sporulation protein AF [Clostridium sp. DL-VIII]|uniref:stage III sporulation protein AF n=1 Tax=Clostridium sp. DL-VIII TaxID=641107 RepID=UPI00023AFF3A|nr:stage III sporulation protein AF [Clostridium sp. DL-VIII]EHI99738.1 stage III sporulation protein AF [Clostridium sp. DL-VIII]